MGLQISFLGGADTVTGSKFLLCHQGTNVLVDCGLFQGFKQLRLRNWADLPVAPSAIDVLLLTHAHLDHSGYLPLLAKNGFRGPVYASAGTRDLCGILLPDSGHLQEEDASFANRHGFSKHAPALPLYTRQEALDCLPLIKAVPQRQAFAPLPGWKVTFQPAGHIVGASGILVEVAGRRVFFSGDVGRPNDALMLPPDALPATDTLIVESTYGDRTHPSENLVAELGPALARLVARGGKAVVPVFAVGRAQAVLHAIAQLKANGTIAHHLPVFLDSPMAVHTTRSFAQHLGEYRLSRDEVEAMARCATMVSTPEESKALSARHGPMVILSASGMATGGRVLHHLEQHAGDHRNMVILTGYQAPGTRGATLASGARSVRIHGHDVAVRAEVVQLESASAHADATQLLEWMRSCPKSPNQVYVVHGERAASDALRIRIERELKWRALVPEHGATWPC